MVRSALVTTILFKCKGKVSAYNNITEAPTLALELPVPATLLQATWFIIGVMAGRAFKGADQAVQKTAKFQASNPITRLAIKNTLNFLHHFWIGLLMVCYSPCEPITWLGWGLFVDDLPDVPRRLLKLFGSVKM